MSKQKLKQLWSLKKSAWKKSINWKKVWLRRGLNPQLSWLITVCLRGYDRNVWQLFPVLPLHQCLQRTVKNERKQILAITIVEPTDDVRLISLKSRFDAYLPSTTWNAKYVSATKAGKKTCTQKVLVFEKKQKTKCSPAGFEPATSWMQVSCSTHWAMWLWFSMECCSLLRLQPAADCKLITTLPRGDKLEVGGW